MKARCKDPCFFYIYEVLRLKVFLAMKVKLFVTFFVFVSLVVRCYSIDLPEVIADEIYSGRIKTVQMYGDGGSLTNPLIYLNTGQKLHFTFDDLTDEVANYYYTIYHCDRNWKLSKISQQEYLETFVDFQLVDYAFSQNTKVKYINYQLELPNRDIPIKLSGNYVLVVFNKDAPDEPVITWRFFVVEPMVNIEARIKKGSYDQSRSGELQEVDFQILHENFRIKDPHTDLKVVVTQNNRFDNALSGLDPVYFDDKALKYDYDLENNFSGDNEYRSFEIRGINFPGKGVADVSYHAPVYHITLLPDRLRVQERYTYDREINGLYRVEMYDSEHPEVDADYLFVHFTLQMDQVLAGGGVYVFGALTNWQCDKPYEMKWNFEKKQYELEILLKQGYYNYCYAWKDFTTNKIKINALEGSHFETENDYYVYVYYGRFADRYDRLIGYQQFNSLKDRALLNDF